MTGTALRSDGYYAWGSRRYPSVTKVRDDLMAKNLSFVHGWAVASLARKLFAAHCDGEEFARESTVPNPDTGEIVWTYDLVSPAELLRDPEYLKHEGTRFMSRAAARGSCVHAYLQAWADSLRIDEADVPHWVENDIAEHSRRCEPDEATGYVLMLHRWLVQFDPRFLASELAVFHDGLGYAGTMDAIVVIDGQPLVLDLKTTGATGLDHAVQVSAYRHAGYATLDGKTRRRMPATEGAAVLLVTPEKATLRRWNDTREHFAVWKAMLRVWKHITPDAGGGSRGKVTTLKDYTISAPVERSPWTVLARKEKRLQKRA